MKAMTSPSQLSTTLKTLRISFRLFDMESFHFQERLAIFTALAHRRNRITDCAYFDAVLSAALTDQRSGQTRQRRFFSSYKNSVLI